MARQPRSWSRTGSFPLPAFSTPTDQTPQQNQSVRIGALRGIGVSEIISWLPSLLQGLLVTVEITVAAMAVGLVLGIVLATMRLEPRNRWLYIPATVYIELMRGTPLILQLFFVYFALPAAGMSLDPFVAGVLAIGLSYSAYHGGLFRSSIRSVPRAGRGAAPGATV